MDPRNVVTVPDAGDDSADTPSRIGHFEIVGRLGSGGMGVVFEGRDSVLGRRVALKLLHPSGPPTTAPARLLREAQALAKLAHPNVVGVFEIGMSGGDPFIAMELVEGETLREWMERSHDWREVLDLFIAVGHGLAAAHALGIVHRDFKPSNVLIDKRGVPKLGDFGLVGATRDELTTDVSSTSDTLTKPGTVMGTPAYMAPEQAQGEDVDARADQFSFAKSLREALGEPRPAALEPILARATNIEPEERFASMEDLLAELARIRRGNRRTWIAIGITAAIAGAAVIAFGIGTAQSSDEDPCPVPRERIAAAWSTARAQALTRSAVVVDPRQGAARIQAAGRLLDPYANEWSSVAVQTCKATRVEHTQSDTLFDLRMRCLDRRLSEMTGSVERIATASDPEQLEKSIGAIPLLTSVSSCADTEHITRELDLPVEPAARATAEALAARIQAIELDGRADRLAGLLERSHAVVADARRLDHPGTLASALATQIRVDHHALDPTHAEANLRELTQVAARAHRDDDEAFAWTQLIITIGDDSGRPDEGLAMVAPATAAVLRAGDPVVLRVPLLLAQAIVLDQTPKIAEGLSRLAEARALLVKNGAERPDSPLAALLANIALETGQALLIDGAPEKGVIALREAIDRYRAMRGPDSTDEAVTLHNLGVAFQRLDKKSDALASLREAARINELKAAGTARLGSNLLSIASVLGDSGQWDESLKTYDRAVELLRDAAKTDPQQLAGLLLGRAMALQHAGRFVESRAGYDEAIAAFETTGAVGSNLPLARLNRGHLSFEEKRWGDAIADYQKTVEEFEKVEGQRRIVHPLLGLGKALVMAGRPAEAIAPLEKALQLADKRPLQHALARAWLARAVAATSRDRRRIDELTTAARTELKTLADSGDETAAATAALADFERWLAERR